MFNYHDLKYHTVVEPCKLASDVPAFGVYAENRPCRLNSPIACVNYVYVNVGGYYVSLNFRLEEYKVRKMVRIATKSAVLQRLVYKPQGLLNFLKPKILVTLGCYARDFLPGRKIIIF